MAAKVDTGDIIAVRPFPLFEGDSVFSVTQRCYAAILDLFYEMMSLVLQNKPLPTSDEVWTRNPYKRSELNELCRITLDMPADEIRRLVLPGPISRLME